jgi:hypothetical protein
MKAPMAIPTTVIPAAKTFPPSLTEDTPAPVEEAAAELETPVAAPLVLEAIEDMDMDMDMDAIEEADPIEEAEDPAVVEAAPATVAVSTAMVEEMDMVASPFSTVK